MEQLLGARADIAGPENQHRVASLRRGRNEGHGGGAVRSCQHRGGFIATAPRGNRLCQAGGIRAEDSCLAGSVDR